MRQSVGDDVALDRDRGVTLIEMVIGMTILAIVLAVAMTWLLSAQRTVATSTARGIDNASAQTLANRIDLDVRYASQLYTSNGGAGLWVVNCPESGCTDSDPGTCSVWYTLGQPSSPELLEETNPPKAGSVVAKGVLGLAFAGNSSGSYNGLISVRFTLKDPSASADKSGVSVDQAITASNMTTAVPADLGSDKGQIEAALPAICAAMLES